MDRENLILHNVIQKVKSRHDSTQRQVFSTLSTKIRIFLSHFPLGFCSCYYCGGKDHFSTRDCPEIQNGNFNKMKFFQEMWLHKPHTKRADYDKTCATSRNNENSNYNSSQILNTQSQGYESNNFQNNNNQNYHQNHH